MAIFPSLAPILGNSAATSRVSSLTCLSGRAGLSFSSVCSPGKGWVRFCARSESAPSQIAAAIQRMKRDGLVNLLYRMTILSLVRSPAFRRKGLGSEALPPKGGTTNQSLAFVAGTSSRDQHPDHRIVFGKRDVSAALIRALRPRLPHVGLMRDDHV